MKSKRRWDRAPVDKVHIHEDPEGFEGFTTHSYEVQLIASFNGREVLKVRTDYHELEIYVSPTGRSLRVWRDHRELREP